MKTFAQFSIPSLHTLGPFALLAASVAVTILLARPRRPAATAQEMPMHRLGVPRGLVRWLVIGAVALVTLLILGIDLRWLWATAVTGLSLVAIGFVAMWSILSHMLASILIVIFRPFEVGDRVEIVGDDPILGDVVDLNPVYTTLRTEDGGILKVPNNLFFQKVLKRHAPTALTCLPATFTGVANAPARS